MLIFLFFETTSCLAFLKIFKQTCWSHLVTLEEQTLLLRIERVKEPLKTRSILNGIKLEWNILFKNFQGTIERSNVTGFGNQLLVVKLTSENQCLATSFRTKYWTLIKTCLFSYTPFRPSSPIYDVYVGLELREHSLSTLSCFLCVCIFTSIIP